MHVRHSLRLQLLHCHKCGVVQPAALQAERGRERCAEHAPAPPTAATSTAFSSPAAAQTAFAQTASSP